MTQWHLKSRKRATGGHRNSKNRCTKKLAWKGGDPADTKIGEEDVRKKAITRGNTTKVFAEEAVTATVSDGKKNFKAQILNVSKNPANKHYERRNIITKGAVIEIEVNGETKQAIVTSRPGQSGNVSAKLAQ